MSREQSSAKHTVPSCGGIYYVIKNPQLLSPEVFQCPRSAGSGSKIMESRTEWCINSHVNGIFKDDSSQ